MYLYTEIYEKYVFSPYGSVDFYISEYILTNLEAVLSESLSYNAKEAGVSKSAMSKYVSKMTKFGSWNGFVESLRLIRPRIDISNQMMMNSANTFFSISETDCYASDKVIQEFTDQLRQTEKIIFLGDVQFHSAFIGMIKTLLKDGIKARYISGYYSWETYEEFRQMKKNDMIVFVSPEDTYYDSTLWLASVTDLPSILNECKAVKYFIGKEDDKEKGTIRIIPTYEYNNILLTTQEIYIFSAKATVAYINSKKR